MLRATCEAFIMAVTKLAVEPMLSFITKVTAVKVAASSAGRGKPLREQVRLLASPSSQMHLLTSPSSQTHLLCGHIAAHHCGSHQSQLCLRAERSWSLRPRLVSCASHFCCPTAQPTCVASPLKALEALATSWGASHVLSGHQCGCRHLLLLPGLKRWWRK